MSLEDAAAAAAASAAAAAAAEDPPFSDTAAAAAEAASSPAAAAAAAALPAAAAAADDAPDAAAAAESPAAAAEDDDDPLPLLRTSSLPEPIVLDISKGSIQLATTFDDPTLQNVIMRALLTDGQKILPLSEPIEASLGLGEIRPEAISSELK